MQRARDRQRLPRYLDAAQNLYGPAFEVRGPDDMRDALADWSSLTIEQRSYATAHLLYLNLQAQAVSQRLLAELRDNSMDLADDTDALTRATLQRLSEREVDDAPREGHDQHVASQPEGSLGGSNPTGREGREPAANPTSASDATDVPDPEALTLDYDEPSSLAELFNQGNEETTHEHL